APEVEERFRVAREWARREMTVRAAVRAARQSARDRDAALPGEAATRAGSDDGALQSVRAHAVVRYAGPAVGPDRIDRDVVIRLLRAPGGPWIVYAFDLASDPPGPIPF
ncbi:MAG TPA: hypothetical protein VLT84_00925, partial [Acidobacteriota bacterium]|nr:hypothetical protein [Acidobacteriota bacterium]